MKKRFKILFEKISLRKAAKITGLSHETIRQWKLGVAPNSPELIKLSEALNISLDWLLMGRGGMYYVEQGSEQKEVIRLNKKVSELSQLVIKLRKDNEKFAEVKKKLQRAQIDLSKCSHRCEQLTQKYGKKR